jgi:hypothetical protein
MVCIFCYYVWKQSNICELKNNSIANIVFTKHVVLWQNIVLFSVVFKLCCSHKFDEMYCIHLQPPSLLQATAMQVVASTLAIFVICILLSVQPFSISWKLLYWTRCRFVQNVVVYHTTISILKANLVNCCVFGLAEPSLLLMVHQQLILMDASLWSCIVIACAKAMQ